MQMSMYQASVPVCIKMLGNLRGILEKAAAHAESKKIDEAAFIEARLFPDMLPLRNQVQIATDMAKSVARLGGTEPPAFDDSERSFSISVMPIVLSRCHGGICREATRLLIERAHGRDSSNETSDIGAMESGR